MHNNSNESNTLNFMKRILFISIAITCLFISGFSQENETSQKLWHPSQGAMLDGKTLLKANLTGLTLGNYSFSAERIIGEHLSLVAGIGYVPMGKLPYASLFSEHVEVEDKYVDMLQVDNLTLSLEMRFYTGTGYGRGFYLSPYYRYGKSAFGNIQTDYFNVNEESYDISLDGNLTTHSGGILFGYQWLVGKRRNIAIDWSILGVHAGGMNANIFGKTAQTLTIDEQQDVEQAIEDILDENLGKYPAFKHTTNVTSNTSDINIKGPWAFFRAGLSVGIRL